MTHYFLYIKVILFKELDDWLLNCWHFLYDFYVNFISFYANPVCTPFTTSFASLVNILVYNVPYKYQLCSYVFTMTPLFKWPICRPQSKVIYRIFGYFRDDLIFGGGGCNHFYIGKKFNTQHYIRYFFAIRIF